MRYILFASVTFLFSQAFCQNQKHLEQIETAIDLNAELRLFNQLKELNYDIQLGSLCWISYPENLERKIELKKRIDISYPELKTKAMKSISNQSLKIELDSVFTYIDLMIKFSEENMFRLKAMTDYSNNLTMKKATSVLKEEISPLARKVDDLLNKIIFQEELKLRSVLDEM